MNNIISKKKMYNKSVASEKLCGVIGNLNLSILAFANQLNTSRQNVYNWCKGRDPSLSVKLYFKDKYNIDPTEWNDFIDG